MQANLEGGELQLALLLAGWVRVKGNPTALFNRFPPRNGDMAYEQNQVKNSWNAYVWESGHCWRVINTSQLVNAVFGDPHDP